MKLKSSNNQSYILIFALIFIVIVLIAFKSITSKSSKYAQTPDFDQNTTLDFIQITLKEKHFKKLKDKRDKALSDGVLETSDEDYVPATIGFNNKDYKAEIRLKGDWTDHLVGNKWSFRVKLKDDKTILGMRKFSIHTPKSRNYINEWLYHKAIKDEDLFGLRYGFLEGAIHVKLNNSSKYFSNNVGVYAIEETFDKRTIESNKRKESIILKFSEDYWWREVKKGMEVGYETGQTYNKFMNPQLDLRNKLPIAVFSESKVIADSIMNNYFKLSKNLLEDVRQGKKTLDEVFDVKELAMQNAILNLFGAVHGTYVINLRFYYNPITSKLEPIAFDGNSGVKLKKYEHFLLINQETDSIYLKELAYALEKVSQKKYVDNLYGKYKGDISNYSIDIKKEFGSKGIAIQNLRYNQDILKNELLRLKVKYDLDVSIFSAVEEELGIIEFKTPKVASWINQGTILKDSNLKFKNETVYSLERKSANNPSYTTIPNNVINFGERYEFSLIVKKGNTGNRFGVRIQGVYPNRADAVFNLENGKVESFSHNGGFEVSDAKIKSLGNGWYKCSLITKPSTSNVKLIFGPTNKEKKSNNWEGPTIENCNVFIISSSLKLEQLK